MLEKTISHFVASLIPLDQLDALLPDDKQTLLAIHTLAHTASIHIYRPLASDDPAFFEKCLRSARACVAVIKHIGEQDYGFLDPIIGVRVSNSILVFDTYRRLLFKALLVIYGGYAHDGA